MKGFEKVTAASSKAADMVTREGDSFRRERTFHTPYQRLDNHLMNSLDVSVANLTMKTTFPQRTDVGECSLAVPQPHQEWPGLHTMRVWDHSKASSAHSHRSALSQTNTRPKHLQKLRIRELCKRRGLCEAGDER